MKKICDQCGGLKQLGEYQLENIYTVCTKCSGTGEIEVNEIKRYVDPRNVKLIDIVKDNKKVRFSYYRDKQFWYECEDGLIFPIDLSEIDNPAAKATLLAEDKAIFFMRWIRKYIESCK